MWPSPHAYARAVARVAKNVRESDVIWLRSRVKAAYKKDKTIFVAGNGGSATVADHFALGMSLNLLRETGKGARALSLSASPMMLSAAVNDFGGDWMFSAQLAAMARKGDFFLAISASGKSKNLASAVQHANLIGMHTAAIVGVPGPVSEHARLTVELGTDDAAVAEDVTIMLLHWVYCSLMVKR